MVDTAFSVVIPAHDERRVIARTLTTLLSGGADMQVIVVCNGCSDGTADIVAGFAPAVQLVTLARASKVAALAAGDAVAQHFPRLYVDADVDLTGAAAAALADAVRAADVHAAGPSRALDTARSSVLVRSYYAVWQRLPAAGAGLFGRGAVAFDRLGHERVVSMPMVLADDLFIHNCFLPSERVVVGGALVTVHAPRTLKDLVRRRVRAVTGNAQQFGGTSHNGVADVVRLLADAPLLLPQVLVFLLVTLRARRLAARAIARGDFTTWLRDESSRS